MFEIPLQYSIHTLDGKELVPAGTVLTEDVIRRLLHQTSARHQRACL